MNCEFIKKNIADVVERTLPQETLSEVDAHLKSCNNCADLLTRFAHLWQAWEKQEHTQPSPAFWFNLQQRIKKTDEKEVGIPSLILGGARLLRPIATVAALVVAVLAGSYMGRFVAGGGALPSQVRASSGTEQVFDYYLGGLDDSPRGSVGDFYTNPDDATDAAAGENGATDSGDSAYVTPSDNG
jgi:predicted anti-sigma-YlaC factor YlaD